MGKTASYYQSCAVYRRLCGISCGCVRLFYSSDVKQKAEWDTAMSLNSDLKDTVQEIGKEHDTPVVTAGTFLENMKSINIKDNSYDIVMVVWFRWDGNDNLDMNQLSIFLERICGAMRLS